MLGDKEDKMRRELRRMVKEQLGKKITKCVVKNIFCPYSTPTMCLSPKECELPFKPAEMTFKERR